MKRIKPPEPLPIKRIAVLLADDHAAVRKSLKILLELDSGIEVVGEAANGLDAVRLARRLHPEVIVMDLAMPLLTGLQATQQIMETLPATKVLILSAHSDQEYIRQAMVSGASGYLIKQGSVEVLARAVREVFKGKLYLSSLISKHLRDQCRKSFDRQTLMKRNAAPIGSSNAMRSSALI